MNPIPRFPGVTYLVTRRTNEGIFRLLPSDEINHICLFCLLCAAEQFKIELHAICFMSNHFHLVLTDTIGKLSEFMHWLDMMISRCMNSNYSRRGIIWEPGSYHSAKLCDDDSILEKIVYTITNPVAAKLVKKPQDWPGVISLPRHYMGLPLKSTRPRVHFGKKTKVPATAKLQLTKPAAFDDLSIEQFRKLVNDHVQARCEDIRAELFSQGGKFLGREKVLEFSPEYRPANAFLESDIIPLIACKDRERRQRELQEYKAFRAAHAKSREAFRQGQRQVHFPAGTNWWRKYAGVLCEPISSPEEHSG